MRPLFRLQLMVVVLAMILVVAPLAAQERSSTGRHKPISVPVEKDEVQTSNTQEIGSWTIEIKSGLMSGSHLFDARHALDDSSIVWVPESDEEWASQRIRVGLENSFAMGFQVQRRMGSWYSLRAGVSYSRMDMNAEAPIGESAEVFFYDQADVWLFHLGTEVRLTVLTPSFPYVALDLAYLDFSPIRSDFLSQSNLGGTLALGYHYQFDPAWAISLEAGLTRTALSSIGFEAPEGVEKENIEYESDNQILLFELKLGIRVRI